MKRIVQLLFAAVMMFNIANAQTTVKPPGAIGISGNFFRVAATDSVYVEMMGSPKRYYNLGIYGKINQSLNTELIKKLNIADSVVKYVTPSMLNTAIAGATIPDATTTVKGKIKLAGDLSGTADLPTVPGLANKVDKITGKGLSTEDYTSSEKTKLAGIASGATANQTDAYLLNRVNHTGLQPISTVTNLQTELDSKVNKTTTITGGGGIVVGGDLSTAVSLSLDETYTNNRYLKKTANDDNGANKLTLGGLETPTAQITNLTLPSLNVGSISQPILTVDVNGLVSKATMAAISYNVANAAGSTQFPVVNGGSLRFAGSGDTDVSFNASTNTVTINSIPGAGGGGAVTSFNGRTGGVVSANGDYSTDQVTEGTNKYFTEGRVRTTPLTGLTGGSGAISATDNILQAFGKLQTQAAIAIPNTRNLTVSGAAGRIIASGGTQNLTADREWTVDLTASGVTAGSYTKTTVDAYGRVTGGTNPTTIDGYGITDAARTNGSNATGTWPISITGNAATATDATKWGNVPYGGGTGSSTGIDFMYGYNSTTNTAYNLNKAAAQAFYDINNGATLNNSISGNAATATNSAQWNGLTFDQGNVTSPTFFITGTGSTGYGYSTLAQLGSALNVTSGGETLQSVWDRGKTIVSANIPNIVYGKSGVINYSFGNPSNSASTNYVIGNDNAGDILTLGFNGNVGIGIDPTTKFDVNGNIKTTSGVLISDGNQIGIRPGIDLYNRSESTGQIGTTIKFGGYNDYGLITGQGEPTTSTGGDLKLQTYASNGVLNDGIRINRIGNTTIGYATDQAYTLAVNGTGYFAGQLTLPDGVDIYYGSTAAGVGAYYNNINDAYTFYNGTGGAANAEFFRTTGNLTVRGNVTAPQFNGALNGNANTSTYWGGLTADYTTYGSGNIEYIQASFSNKSKPANAANVAAFLGLGSNAYTSTPIPTNNNQLTNGAGYLTSATLPSNLVTTNTVQDITGIKTFNATIISNANITSQASGDKYGLHADGSIESYNPATGSSAKLFPNGNAAITGTMTIRMNTPASSIALDVGGNVRAFDFETNSDSTLKKNITPLVNTISKLSNLKGYSYDWKNDGRHAIGIIAQEVQKEYPEVVFKDDKGILNVDYSKLVAPLIQANNEQQKEIDQLKKDIQELKQLIKR